MANEVTIPMLPCKSIDETLEFYTALGFEITYQQRPNTYGCVKYEEINLHFFTLKGYEPKDSYSTCFVLVPELAVLHEAFCKALRSRYGKLPVAGIPRISKLNKSNWDKQKRFNIIDPGGNWIRFAQKGDAPVEEEEAAPDKTGKTRLARATSAADLLVEGEGNYAAAAQMLDKALTRVDSADDEADANADRVRALVLRASLAVQMDDRTLAGTLLGAMREISLDADVREALAAELERADDLERLLG